MNKKVFANMPLVMMVVILVGVVVYFVLIKKPVPVAQQQNTAPTKTTLTPPALVKDKEVTNSVSNDTVQNIKEWYIRINKGVRNVFIDSSTNQLRLPLEFCLTEEYKSGKSAYVACESSSQYIELDLNKHKLPIDKILSLAISPDGEKVAYITYTNGEYCKDDKRGFVYNVTQKTTKEIDAQNVISMCGAVSSYIRGFSPKGRYVYIDTNGPTEFSLTTLYDTKKDKSFNPDIDARTLDTLGIVGGYYGYTYLHYGLNEEYVIYLASSRGDCTIENQEPGPSCSYDTIMVKNVDSEKIKVITTSNRQYGYNLKELKGENLLVEKYRIDPKNYEYQAEEAVIENISQYLP